MWWMEGAIVADVGQMKVLSSELGAEDEEAFWWRGQRCLLVLVFVDLHLWRFLSCTLLGPGKPPGINLNPEFLKIWKKHVAVREKGFDGIYWWKAGGVHLLAAAFIKSMQNTCWVWSPLVGTYLPSCRGLTSVLIYFLHCWAELGGWDEAALSLSVRVWKRRARAAISVWHVGKLNCRIEGSFFFLKGMSIKK